MMDVLVEVGDAQRRVCQDFSAVYFFPVPTSMRVLNLQKESILQDFGAYHQVTLVSQLRVVNAFNCHGGRQG